MLQAGLMLGLFCFGCQHTSLLVSVSRILDYALNTGENSNAFLLGAFLAKAQIKASEEMTKDRYKLFELNMVSYKLDLVLSRSIGLIDPQAVNKTNVLRNLNKVQRLEEKQLNYTLTDKRYLEFGVPSRYESDECMLPLLDGCKQPGYCLDKFSNTFSTGYSLIHRALFLSLFNLMECDKDRTRSYEIMKNIASICSQVYSESEQISYLGFPLPLQDLYIEQVNKTNVLRNLNKVQRLEEKQLNYTLTDKRYLEFGVPSRYESDECMLPLLDGCKQPGYCLDKFSNTFSTGYSLIHRALFLSLFNLMECDKDRIRSYEIMKNIASICSQVYSESEQISYLGFPLPLQDLYIEQVGVCGLHLYKEFLSTINLNFILKKSKLFHSRFGIKKRFSKSTWDSHLSGVGLAALSAFITQINLLSSGDINRNM